MMIDSRQRFADRTHRTSAVFLSLLTVLCFIVALSGMAHAACPWICDVGTGLTYCCQTAAEASSFLDQLPSCNGGRSSTISGPVDISKWSPDIGAYHTNFAGSESCHHVDQYEQSFVTVYYFLATAEFCAEGDPCCGEGKNCGKDPCKTGLPTLGGSKCPASSSQGGSPCLAAAVASSTPYPVRLGTGAKVFDRTDLELGSLIPITIKRQYNSRSGYDSPLGYGWGFVFDKRLYVNNDNTITLRGGFGAKQRFAWVGGEIKAYQYDVPACAVKFAGNRPTPTASFSSGTSSSPSGGRIRVPSDSSVAMFTHAMPGESCDAPIDPEGILTRTQDGLEYIYTYKNGDKETYDSQGRLSALIDRSGNRQVFYYELSTRQPLEGLLPSNVGQTTTRTVAWDYRLSRIVEQDASGAASNRYVLFHYNTATGRLDEIVDNLGRTVIYAHDEIGNLTGITGPAGTTIYGYTDPVNIHAITTFDEGSGTYVNTYDSLGRVLKQTHGNGLLFINYLLPGKSTHYVSIVRDPSGVEISFQDRMVAFDAHWQPSRVTDHFGNVTTYDRDDNADILTEVHWENLASPSYPSLAKRSTYQYTYDSRKNMLSRTVRDGTMNVIKATTYTYHPQFSLVTSETETSVVDPQQNKSAIYTYDNIKGTLLTRTESGLLGNGTTYSFTTAYTYYPNGKLHTIDGPRTDVQDVTTFTYTSQGDIESITRPLIGTTTYSNHDGLGNPRTVTDPNGNATAYTFDNLSRVTSVRAPGDANAAQINYAPSGCSSCGIGGATTRIAQITLPEGNTITYHYDDGLGNLTSITDNAGNSIVYTYDSEGNRLKEDIKDSGGSLQKTVSFVYDNMNRVKRIVNPDATFTEYGYDFLGNRASAKDPKGNSTGFLYDDIGRLRNVTQPGSISTAFGYNTNDNLTTVTDDNNTTTTYVYDDMGRVYQVISPDTGTTTYTYDPAGNLLTKTDAMGVTISYAYDALNRLTLIDFPADVDTVYSYDTCLNGKGRICSMTDASGTTSYEYSPKGQVKKETKVIDRRTYITQYTYDQNGNLKTMTYPSGKVITYNYTNDRATSVLNGAANVATNIAYKPFGGMSAITFGNGKATSITYDTQYHLSSLATGTFQNLTYGHDYNGNITSIAPGKTYSYDALDRLGTANGPWGVLEWEYDGVGNRKTKAGITYDYMPGTNKMTNANGISFGYDDNGNTTTQAARIYTYNQNQRLHQVVDGAMTANYTYNGNGQRVKKNVNGTITIFHYSLNGQIIAESNSAGTITAEYVYLNGQPLAKMEGANTYYYHNDHLGTPQKMTDNSGTVVWAADYKPFGEATVTVSTITNNLRFPGQYYDVETGLHYNYFRDYDTALGRYKQADPIGLVGGVNPYLYVSANPMNIIDSLGLYDSYVHFDITYRLAIDAGFKTQDAYRIAQGNQRTDTDWNTTWMNFFGGIQLHFLPRDVALENIDYALNYKSLEYFGRSLHMLQDTYSHAGYKWYKLGHLKDVHGPDNFRYSCGREQKMINETWQYLLKYRERYY